MTFVTRTPSTSTSTYSFEHFLDGWHHQQNQLLTDITAAVTADKGDDGDNEAKELIARAMCQFEEYYEVKSRCVHHHDVFSFFSPPWCTSVDCAFMWVAGFRPGVLLELVSDSVHNLYPRQIEALQRLKRKTRVEEKQITEELARIQESIAAPPMIHTLRGTRWSMENGPITTTINEPIDQFQAMLQEVVAKADILRVTTAANIAEILVPSQGLKFLAAALRLQQGMRTFQFSN